MVGQKYVIFWNLWIRQITFKKNDLYSFLRPCHNTINIWQNNDHLNFEYSISLLKKAIFILFIFCDAKSNFFFVKLRKSVSPSQVGVRAQKPCYLWAIRGWLGECSKMVEAATGHLLPRNPHTLDGSGQPHFQATGFIRSSHCAANIHKDQTWKNQPKNDM